MRQASQHRLRSFAFTNATLLILAGRAAHAETVLLSTLDLTKATQGFGSPQADKSVDQHPIVIAGQKFEHGFGTHSIGALAVDLKGGSTKFHAVVGIDDETNGKGSVKFSVYADGKQIWDSGIIKGGQPGKGVDLDVTGVKHLTLRAGDAGDGYEFDHAVWADARFEVTGEKPVTFKPMPHDPVISIAPPAPTPEIHQPLIYGGKPGEPFLLTIAATGEEPLSFSANGLPAGLQLDGASGIISGALQAESTTPVTLHVRNASGTADQTLAIVAGGKLALTPPMGWNSYDAYGDNVTETEMIDNAKAVAKLLKPHGWQYMVVDYCWYDPKAYNNNPNEHAGAKLPIDDYGRLQPAINRFPTAEGGKGFKPLADAIHAMGLKFGIHIMRGIPRVAVEANTPILGSNFKAADAADTKDTCPWCPFMYGVKGATPAGQNWYDSIFKQYAAWGLDFVKVDDLTQPYHGDEVHAIHEAIARCGRSIVFSTSPGETPIKQADHVGVNANMWRATGDFWDTWHQLNAAFGFAQRWTGHGGVGHWPDLDMLPLGHLSVKGRAVDRDRWTRFTKSEQVLMLTLWSMTPSPLMLGGSFSDADTWEISLLTNDDVLAVNQDVAGIQGKRIAGKDGLEIWARQLSDGSQAIALFNRTDEDTTIQATWSELGLDGKYAVRDLWQRKDLGTMKDRVELPVTAHGAVLLRITKALAP